MVKEDKHDNKEILVCLSCGSKDADSVLKSVLEAEIVKIINEGKFWINEDHTAAPTTM